MDVFKRRGPSKLGRKHELDYPGPARVDCVSLFACVYRVVKTAR